MKSEHNQESEQWSEGLRKRTVEIIERVDVRSFLHEDRCHLKKIHKDTLIFGWITLMDVLSYRYTVYQRDVDKPFEYDSPTDIVRGGWVVD